MRCPNCGSELNQMHCKNVCVDFCKKCKGTWFDSGELNSVIDYIAASENIPDAAIELEKDIVGKYEISEDVKSCPHCNSEMKKLNYAYDSNIILDKCDSCGGIWADGDEIMKLAVFRKGNPVLDRMGAAIAEDRGAALNKRYSDSSSVSSSGGAIVGLGLRIILPISDDQKRHTFPFVVVGIILINVAIFLFQSLYFKGNSIGDFYCQFGLVPDSAFSSLKGGYSFFTSIFIHGSFWHLFGNMLFLWIFADNIEDRFGHIKFLLLYIAFGIAASFLHIALDLHSHIPAIGASGAISGAMGAYFVLYPSAKIKTYAWGRIVDIPALLYLGGWLIFQVVFAWIASGRTEGGVAWFAHIGGFAAGAVTAALLKYIEKTKERNGTDFSQNADSSSFDPKKL